MVTAGQVLECSFERWYHRFESVTFRSQVLPLPQDFVDYLVQDGVYLPEQNLAVRCDSTYRLVSANLALIGMIARAASETFCARPTRGRRRVPGVERRRQQRLACRTWRSCGMLAQKTQYAEVETHL